MIISTFRVIYDHTERDNEPAGQKGNTKTTREEYNEFRYIRKSLKDHDLDPGCQLTIRTDAGHEYKQALNNLYESLNFHPASVRVDTHFFDDKERVIFIFGRTWDWNGESRSWEELYTAEEKARFAAALK